MTTQMRNAQQVELLKGDFQARYEPQFALANSVSLHSTLDAARAFWTLGSQIVTVGGTYASDILSNYHLFAEKGPVWSRYNLAPYIDFVSASLQYLEYADDVNFDIIGNEATVQNPGLTIGGWTWCDAPSIGALVGFGAKYNPAANQRSYALYKSAGNAILFSVSTNGIADVIVTSTPTISAGAWIYVVGRFTPSAELAVFVNNVKTTNVVGIPATIFNSSATFRLGDRRAEYLDGRLSHWFITASALSDAQIGVLYEQTRPMFGV